MHSLFHKTCCVALQRLAAFSLCLGVFAAAPLVHAGFEVRSSQHIQVTAIGDARQHTLTSIKTASLGFLPENVSNVIEQAWGAEDALRRQREARPFPKPRHEPSRVVRYAELMR